MVKDINIENEKFYDSYELIMSSLRVSDDVKELLKQKLFLEQNPEIIYNLSRLLFLVDFIEIEENEIVARKKVSRIKEPKIPVNEVIYKYLLKIKHNSLSDHDIKKLNELQQYPSYIKLYKLISLAIDLQVKVQKIIDDKNLKMTIEELEVFLNNE